MPKATINSGDSAEYTSVAGATSVGVSSDAASVGDASVHIDGLHRDDGTDDYVLGPGESQTFRARDQGVVSMTITAVDGNVTIRYGTVASLGKRQGE